MAEYTGKRIVPRHCGAWDQKKNYEMLTIVRHEESGNSYISRRDVPAGTALTDTAYWMLHSVYSQQIADAERHLAEAAEDVRSRIAASEEKVAGELADTEKTVEQKTTAAENLTNANKAELNRRMDGLDVRLNANVTASTESSADYAAEVVDARVDEAGKEHGSLGDCIRSVDKGKADKAFAYGLPFSYPSAVNINTKEHQVEFPGNFIFLTSTSNYLIEKAKPVPYDPAAVLTYLCYRIRDNTFVTYEWYDRVGEDEVVVFVVVGANPVHSYGRFPFLVDGVQPLDNGTVAGSHLANSAVNEAKMADGAVTEKKLADSSVTSRKLKFDAVMEMPMCLPVTQYTWSGSFELMENGAYHYYKTADETGYKGGGFSVPKAERFRKLYIDMNYQADETMHFYVIASPLVELGTIPPTDGERKNIRLEIPKGTLDKKGHNENILRIAFTSERVFNLYINSVKVRYVDTGAEYFGEDYEAVKEYAYGLPFSYQGPVNINTAEHRVEFPGNFLILSSRRKTFFSPEPVPYNPDAALTYICYNISEEKLVTHDWYDDTTECEVVVFVVDPKSPARSYGRLPFLVDGLQPFGGGTVAGSSLKDGSVTEGKLAAGLTPWKGKKVLFMGDSITALGTGDRGWPKYFNEIIQPSAFVNTAVASARWCDYNDTVYDGNPVFNGPDSNHNNVMGNQVEKLLRGKDPSHPHYSHVPGYDDFDMILIACGTNDGVPSGEFENVFTADGQAVAVETVSRLTMQGAFRYTIEKLQGMYPNARIFICTPIQGYITTRNYAGAKARGDYLKLLAGRMSLEVIDTFECGICDIYEKKSENGRYLIDGLHPNAAGAKKMGQYNAAAVMRRYV